jgi:Xaa-Pro dipeptidase
MSGPNGAKAYRSYQQSSARAVERDDLLLIHCNSFADGYWTDITRTYAFSPLDSMKHSMFEAILAARSAALAAAGPGVPASEVDRAARDVLRGCGYGPAFRHPTGHGVGFEAIDHTSHPLIHPLSHDLLRSGMVFNIEPGIYIDGYGGMRHCDVVAITDDGAELLTPFHATLGELVLDR